MRAICFGRLNVQDAGVPLNFGRTTLSASMTAADETLSVTSATPFCSDMVPFKLDIEPTTGAKETVIVKGIGGTSFTVQRGADGTIPVAHTSGAVVVAKFQFAGWELSTVAGLTGKAYFGKRALTAGGAGTIYEFYPNAPGTNDKSVSFIADVGNPLELSEYGIDAAVGGEGLFVTLWQR